MHMPHSASKEKFNAAVQKSNILVLDMMRALGDIPVRYIQLCIYFIDNTRFSPVFIGFIGTLTSIIGCYKAWKA